MKQYSRTEVSWKKTKKTPFHVQKVFYEASECGVLQDKCSSPVKSRLFGHGFLVRIVCTALVDTAVCSFSLVPSPSHPTAARRTGNEASAP